jgi:uncharacterized protein with von Willebrand factor type A (vWA) domain
VARASRWDGFAAPAYQRAIEADRFDVMEYREIVDQADALQVMATELGETHHYITDLLADMWTAAYKAFPRLRERAAMDPSHAVNHQVMTSLLGTPEWTELHAETIGEPYAAALAVISQQDQLRQLLDETRNAQHTANQAAQAQRDLTLAAQQAQAALTAHTGEDGGNDGAAAPSNAGPGGAEEGTEEGPGGTGEEIQDEAQQALVEALASAVSDAEEAERIAATATAAADEQLVLVAPRIRIVMRAAVAAALEQVRAEAALMIAWGLAPGQLKRLDFAARRRLAQKLAGTRLSQFADLIGRFRFMASGERTRRVPHAPGELVGVTLGDDVGRLIPSELAALGVPALRASFAARLAEKRLMIYQSRGEDTLGKGAIIACIDCSGSMKGAREAWAKACGLALLDQARNARPRRDFAAVLFSNPDQTHTIHIPAGRPVDLANVVDMAEHFFNGGTDFQTPLTTAADILAADHASAGRTHGDIVLITDGIADLDDEWMQTWQPRKHALDFRVYGVVIAGPPSLTLRTVSDALYRVQDDDDPHAVGELFHTI